MSKLKIDAENIFHQALDIQDSKARDDFLKEVCLSDLALYEELQALLKAHEDEGNFLDNSPEAAPAIYDQSPLFSEKLGTMVGRYKLLQKIGEGGFGVVYMAEQTEPVRRKVALKIIKPGMDTKEVIARFEAERQALALMDHPNIAQVFDAGATNQGRPYFVMELVKGIPLIQFCDENNLSVVARLKLFNKVCRAIQHAHQKGIIHRDIKPSNIMITIHDDEHVPKVIDFGISKALSQRLTEKTYFTEFGQMIGTPSYMSPEQAGMSGLDIDTRSDIYSLGVLLYELLTGSTPVTAKRLQKSGYAEMQRIIREDDPEKPSLRLSTLSDATVSIAAVRACEPKRLSALVRGDLDWIVMKALEKNRDRRYETATNFASDIERFLNHEAVEATPPSIRYKLKKYVQKNKTALSIMATISTILIAATVVSTLMATRATFAEKQGRAAKSDAIAEAERARDAEAEAVEARIAQTHMSFSASLNQARAQRWSQRTGRHFAAADALAQAAELLQDLELESSALKQHRQVLRNELVAGMPLTDIRARPVHNRDPLWAGWEALAPDFIRRAESNAAGDIRVIEATNVLCSFEGPRKIERLGFGPRGEFLFARYWNDKKLQLSIWSVISGEKVLHVDEDLDRRTPVAISKSGLVAVGMHTRADWRIVSPSVFALRKFAGNVFRSRWMVRVYSLDSGAVVNERQFDAFPYCVAFASEDSDKLAVTSGNKLTIWSRSTDSTHETVTSNRLMSLAVAQGVVVVGDNVGRILQWPLDHLDSKPKEFVGHTSLVQALFISPHDLVASSSWDGTSRLWNLTTGEQHLQVTGSELTDDLGRQRATTFYIPGFSNDGLLVATFARPQINAFEVTNSASRRLLRNTDRTAPRVWSMAWHPDEPLLVITTEKGIDVWNPEEGRLVNHVRCKQVWTGVFINNAEHLLTSGAAGVQKWPVKILKAGETTTLEFGEPELLAAGALDGMSVNTTLSIAALDRQNSLELLSLDGAFELVQFAQVPSLNQVVLSPDGKWIFTATWKGNGINVFDVAERKHVKTLAARSGSAKLAVSPDGRLLVASMELLPQQVWKIGSWEKLTTLERPHSETWPGAIAFSPSGHLLAITNDRFSARILETERFADGFTLPSGAQQQSFKALAFNPSGTKLAVAFDHAVEVWNLDEVQRRLRALDLDW